jgi:predicted MFS family arabinose efflux permease
VRREEGEMRKVVLLCLAIFPLLICSGIVYTILSLFIADFGTTKTQIGFLYTSSALAGAISSPLLGRLGDKIGKRPLLIGAMAIFFFVFGGFALARNLKDLLLIMIIEGSAWGAIGISATSLIADLVPSERRGTALGIYNTAWNLGWIIGPIVGGMFSDNFGFRKTFLFASLFILGGIILALLILPQDPKKASDSKDEPSEVAQGS